jgi:putative Mg2+ transporter-C (MgtC) family protein
MHFATETILKMAASAALGGVVGLERELHHKPAGLRTNMFICLGSTMFTMLSLEVAEKFHSDPQRIAAQIIPGIGFIGAGAILREGLSVVGLTTAATMFVVAAIGMGIGYGYFGSSSIATGMILAALFLLRYVERKLGTKFVHYQFSMSTNKMTEASERVKALLDELKIKSEEVSWSREGEHHFLRFSASLSPDLHMELMRRLLQIGELNDIKSAIFSEK